MRGQLTEMARDDSPEARGELLERLTDEVLGHFDSSQREFEIFFDIARTLLREAGVGSRVAFSNEVIDHDDIPSDVLVTLAQDEIDVASPILSRHAGLSEQVLVELAGRLSLAHLAVLAGRKPLTIPVTDVMVGRGDGDVMKALGANEDAAFSLRSVNKMADIAQTDNDLCKTLAAREDLPAEVAERLISRMAHLLAASANKAEANRKVAARTPEIPSVDALKPAIAAMIADIKAGRATLDQIVSKLADLDRGNDICGLLAAVGAIDEMQIFKVLVRKDCAGISTVVKGLGLTEDTWDHISQHRKRRLKLTATEMKFEAADFARRSFAESRTTIEQFQHRRAG